MKQVQTKKLLEASKLPTKIEVGQILAMREPYYDDFYLRNLEAGLLGEEKVLAYLERYGENHWAYLRNIWLNVSGKFECDFVLFTNAGLHLLEVKNYNGHFVYENGECTLNHRVLADNPITQTQRNFRKFQKIVHQLNPQLNVYGTLIFIGEHNSVEINSPVKAITIVKQSEFKAFILKIVEADRLHLQNIETAHLLTHFEKYEDVNSFAPEPIEPHRMQQLRKGVYCQNCQNADLNMNKLYIYCSCGFKERREIGILRTLYEYSVLTQKEQVMKKEALEFLNGQASERYLGNIMNKYLVRNFKGRYTTYQIDPIPYNRGSTKDAQLSESKKTSL